jgi:hypothetical protein
MRTHDLACVCVAALVAAGLFFASPRPAGALVTTTGCAGVTSCTLAELIAGGTMTVNTKLFSDFELEFLDSDGVSPNFSLIVIEGQDDSFLVPGPGIKFSGNGQLVVVGADRLDMAIGFTVTELFPTLDIDGNSLTILSDTVVGTAFLEVGEFVADASGAGLGQKQVETDPFFAPPISTDAIEFPIIQKKLIIEKDILLQGSAAGDFAELDMFEQRFSQVPEPDAALSLVVGAAGLWALSRRRAARVRG